MRISPLLVFIAALAIPGTKLFAQAPARDSQVVNATALEEPPQPLPGSCRAPVYPALLRAGQVEGRVLLEFVVDTAGRIEPTTVRAVNSSHSQFEESARRALLTCRYRPARFNQVLARVMVRTPYTFQLSRS